MKRKKHLITDRPITFGFPRPADAIKCWKCSSEFPYTFCNEPFSPLEYQKRWAYVECMPPHDQIDSYIEQNLTATCRKLRLLSKFTSYFGFEWKRFKCNQYVHVHVLVTVCLFFFILVNDEFVIIRDCFWPDADNECFWKEVPDDIRLESCTTCNTNGCNGFPKHTPSAQIRLNFNTNQMMLNILFSFLLWTIPNF